MFIIIIVSILIILMIMLILFIMIIVSILIILLIIVMATIIMMPFLTAVATSFTFVKFYYSDDYCYWYCYSDDYCSLQLQRPSPLFILIILMIIALRLC